MGAIVSVLNDRDDLIYFSTKTWEHVVSTAFRQHKAQSHCNQIHGYALTFKATFGAYQLDVRNWVVDFGSLKSFKGWLENNFDHKLLIAKDDPYRHTIDCEIGDLAADINIVEATGCEAIARMAWEWMECWLTHNGYAPRCWLHRLEVMEHPGNSAFIEREVRPPR